MASPGDLKRQVRFPLLHRLISSFLDDFDRLYNHRHVTSSHEHGIILSETKKLLILVSFLSFHSIIPAFLRIFRLLVIHSKKNMRGKQMIKMAIVEDEEIYLNQVKEFIDDYKKEEHVSFHLDCFASGTLFMNTWVRNEYDIIFLDIVLKDSIDGMEIANKIREKNSNAIIIFITTMVQYAVKGYEVEALGYLVKPITYFTFRQILNKALKKIDKDEDVFITCSYKEEFAKIPSSDITYFEVANHFLTIHTTHGDYQMRGSLSDMIQLLKNKDFALCNQCYLVNLKYVYGIEGMKAKVYKDTLQISRPKKKAFLDSLTKYCGD